VLSYQVSLCKHDFKIYCDLAALDLDEIAPDDIIENYPAFPVNYVPTYQDLENELDNDKKTLLKL